MNTTETKVELVFDVNNSALLSDAERERIWKKLGAYINDEGILRMNSSESRSQLANKENVIKKFYTLLEKALKKETKRIPTKVPAVIKEGILKKKKLHSKKKEDRKFRTKDFL